MISIEFYFGAFIAWYQQNIVTSKITRHVDFSTRPTYYCKETTFGICFLLPITLCVWSFYNCWKGAEKFKKLGIIDLYCLVHGNVQVKIFFAKFANQLIGNALQCFIRSIAKFWKFYLISERPYPPNLVHVCMKGMMSSLYYIV